MMLIRKIPIDNRTSRLRIERSFFLPMTCRFPIGKFSQIQVSRVEVQPSEMWMPWYNVHKVGELDPEDFESEKLRSSFIVEVVSIHGADDSTRNGLSHGIAKGTPQVALMELRCGAAGPSCVCTDC